MNGETGKIKIEDLGYGEFFETGRNKLNLGVFEVARIIAEHKGLYIAKNARGEYSAKITGKQVFDALTREDYPAVGDWVVITETSETQAVIHKVLPRKTMLKRKSSGKNDIQIIATNIEVAFVVESVDGDYNLNRFERYFVIANDGGVRPVIVLNKTDLISKEELKIKIEQIKKRFGDIDLVAASTLADGGLDELKSYISKGKTYCFLGSSGVGKSSLINKLIGKIVINTGDIDYRTDRGRHTTTGRGMYFLKDGGILIDNPGMREVGMADAGSSIENLFDEIIVLAKKCKFSDCTHIQEPGCKVLAAVQSGKLDEGKYLNYISLKREAEYFEMAKVERKQKERQFGKFIKTAKKQLKKLDY